MSEESNKTVITSSKRRKSKNLFIHLIRKYSLLITGYSCSKT